MRALLVIAVLIVSGSVYSQPPISSSRELIKKDQEISAAHNDPASDHKQGTKTMPLVIEIVNPPNGNAIAAELKENRKDQSAEEGHSVVFNSLLIFVGLLQAGVLFYTALVSNKAANAAKDAGNAALGVALPNLWLFHLDFADMGAANFDAKIQNPSITVSVKNYGGTPAFIESRSVEIICELLLPDEPNYSGSGRAYDVPPETVCESQAVYQLGDTQALFLLSAEDIIAIKEQRKFIWVYGYVQYRDFLNHRHIRRFCKQLIPVKFKECGYSFIDGTRNPKYTDSV